MSLQITVLKVLAGHPEGRASVAELTRYVGILISSGPGWTTRVKRLAHRAPELDIFRDKFVLRDNNGWQITLCGRQFLSSLEATSSVPCPAEAKQPGSTTPRVSERASLRLVVDNGTRPDGETRTVQSSLTVLAG